MAKHIVDDKSKGIVNLMTTQLYLAIVRMALPGLLQGNKLGCLKKFLSTKKMLLNSKKSVIRFAMISTIAISF